MKEDLLSKAKELSDSPDFIVDMFDVTLQWVSPKLLELCGYEESELVGQQATKFLKGTFFEKRKEVVDRIVNDSGERELKINRKDGGESILKTEFQTFTHENTMYIVSKIIEKVTIE